MVAVAIFSIDPVLRRNLEQLPHDDPAFVLVGIATSRAPSGNWSTRIALMSSWRTPRRESCWPNIEADTIG